MKEIQVEIKDGIYNCEIGISTEEWKMLLQSDYVVKHPNVIEYLQLFYAEPEHKATCKYIGEKYGNNPQSYNSVITSFGISVKEKLNRFTILDSRTKEQFWIIPMIGKYINNGKHFEWTLRPELVQAMKELGMDKIESQTNLTKQILIWIKKYKEILKKWGGLKGCDELYKWELLTQHSPVFDVEREDFLDNLMQIDFENLIDKRHHSRQIINEFCDKKPTEYRQILRDLFDESVGVNDRIERYKSECKKLYGQFAKEGYDHQDLRTAAALLTFHDPQKYSFCLSEMYEDFCKAINIKAISRKKPRYEHYLELLHEILPHIKADKELCDMIKSETKNLIQSDILIAQDIVWQMFGSVRNPTTPENIEPMENKYQPYINLLRNSKNLVLTGAPGTGKTYLAKQIAKELIGENYTEEQIGFVQFHPSYDYTDFVEGLRAEETESGNVTFRLYDGVFKEFCKRALNDSNNVYIFIIDEINRGEISKIFGELFFSIDPGYRGIDGKVQTQYSNLIPEGDLFKNGFYVPENVYIIATMNDIDRSVESMDFAMRRRFTWKEISADERVEMLDGNDWAEEAAERMMAINDVIGNVSSLGKAYHIGPAYFLKLCNYENEINKWDLLWKYHLLPLVCEYLRGMPDAETIEKELKETYDLSTQTQQSEDEN